MKLLYLIFFSFTLCIFLFDRDLNFYKFFFSTSCFFWFFIVARDAVKKNILFFLRNFMLVSPGLIAAMVKLVDPNIYFDRNLMMSQTLDIVNIMVIMTNFAIISSQIGFDFGNKVRVKQDKYCEYEKNSSILFVSTFIILIFSFITIWNSSGIILYTVYASTAMNQRINFGVNYIFSNLMFMFLLYYRWKYDVKNKIVWNFLLIMLGVYLIVYVYFLHGIRENALGLLLSIVIFHFIYFRSRKTINLRVIIVFGLLYFVSQLIGVFRYANFSSFEGLSFMLTNHYQIIDGHKFLFFDGTLDDISATFSGIIYLIQHNIVSHQYGLTYLEWIPRTLPSFLNISPEDCAWVFKEHGFSSGGGFFELAEVYYNFGVLGALVVPGIISFLIARLYYGLLYNKRSTWRFFLFFPICISLMRGGWYQTFAWYKATVVGVILYAFIMIVLRAKYKKHS